MNFPVFNDLKIDKIADTINDILDRNSTKIQQLINISNPNWDNFCAPLELLDNELNNYWSIISHLNSVQNNTIIRNAYNACLPKLSQYTTNLLQNKSLFNAIVTISQSAEFSTLSPAKQQAIQFKIRDFKLAGVNLSQNKRQKYQAITLKLDQLNSKFNDNVLDSTNEWHTHITDEILLQGLPAETLKIAKILAKTNNESGFLFTLDFPVYQTIMQYADNQDLRLQFYKAYNTKASNEGVHNKQYDNTGIMQNLLKLRDKKAKLLGFSSYAQLSLEKKMAQNVEEVFEFLNDLLNKSLDKARAEFTELQNFANTYGVTTLEPWDVAYYSEKLKQKQFNFSSDDLRPWFPVDKTLGGLFQLTEKLFQITIEEEIGIDTWHENVQVFKIKQLDGKVKAYFYMDLYARKNKRGGAWMDVCREQLPNIDGTLQLPIAYLSCNFTSASTQRPALLTFEEVTTLFHEFGHGLHHMLSKIDIPSVGGINGVPWDAVELPSQFMENFCWQQDILPMISGHYKTNEPLPTDKLQSLLGAKNFQSAMAMVRQLEFALFDLSIHYQFMDKKDFIYDTLTKIQQKTALLPRPKWSRFANSFTHIFSGGYAAGYYSYKWAEILSSDAFSLFEETNILNPQTATLFLQQILQKGGSEDSMDLFIKFRGRKPNNAALLRHSGIVD